MGDLSKAMREFVEFMDEHKQFKDFEEKSVVEEAFDELQKLLAEQLASELFDLGIVPYDEDDSDREARIRDWILDNYNLEER